MTQKTVEEFLFGEAGVVRLIRERQYERALEIIIKEGDLFPEVARAMNHHRICLAATLGDTAEALRVLEEMLEAGIYYPSVLLGREAPSPGLGSLLGLPEFEQIKIAHQEHYQEAMENAPPVLVTVAPESLPARPPPLLFATHGNVSHVENEIDHYRPATTWGWLLAMPQSSQPWGMEGRYVWGDWEVTEQQLKKYWRLLGQQAEYDPARIVTAGISKGGEVAVWLAMSGTIPARGFIAIAPGGPRIDEPERLLPLVEASREKGLRGYLIVGDQDTSCYEPTMRLAGFLREQGIAHELETHPDVEHWFPPEFEQSLHRALKFIVGEAA
jgi:predicted esterase